MIIEVKDLKVGDEILIPCNSSFKYLRVLRPPVLSKKTHRRNPSKFLYKNIKCSTRRTETPMSHTWNAKTYNYIVKKYEITPEEHNIELYENLNYKTIWLVNRK